MKSVKKKIMVYSVLGLMQVGLLSGVASASPRNAAGPSDLFSYLTYLVQCCEDAFCQNQCSDLQTDCEQIPSKDGNIFGQVFQKQCNK